MFIWNLGMVVLWLTQPGFAGELGWMCQCWNSCDPGRLYPETNGCKGGQNYYDVLQQPCANQRSSCYQQFQSSDFPRTAYTVMGLLWPLQPCDQLLVKCCNSQHWERWAGTWSQQLDRVASHRFWWQTAPKAASLFSSSYGFLLVNFLFLNHQYNILCVCLSVWLCVCKRRVLAV